MAAHRIAWRPSAGDIEIHRRFCAPKLPGRTLLLGATPELRDLLAEHSQAMPKPTVVDMSLAMLHAMTTLARRARPQDECWHVTDWCDVALGNGRFDLVLADMAWWTLSVAKQSQLRDRIEALLAPGGSFVARFRFRIAARVHDDPRIVAAAYLDRLNDSDGNEQSVRDAMLSHLYDITVDTVGRRMNRERMRVLLMTLRDAESNTARRRFLDVTLGRLIGADWTSQTRAEVMAPLLEKFDCTAQARAADYEASAYPVLVLRKRSSPAAAPPAQTISPFIP